MKMLFIAIVIGLFVAMLFLNIYFRVKVFKAYKVLVQNKIEFEAVHIFSKKRLESEILPKYPKFGKEIVTFVHHIRYSMRMASILIFLITAFGAILMYFKD
jgi:hypothetical protein